MSKSYRLIAILAVIVIGLTGLVASKADWFGVAGRLGDCISMQSMAREAAAAGRDDVAAYRYQEAAACRGENLDAEGSEDEQVTPVPAAKVSDKSKANDKTAKQTGGYQPYSGEQLTTRPAASKVSVNSYGPKKAVHPDFYGKDMAKLTADEARAELKYRMSLSPTLTAATGAALGAWSYDEADAKAKLFASDTEAWKKVVRQLSAKLDKSGGTVKQMPAGTYVATYALNGDKGSYVRIDESVNRDKPFMALVLADGTILRLECGYQEYWIPEQPAAPAPAAPRQQTPAQVKQAPSSSKAPAPSVKKVPPTTTKKMPKPAPPMERTPEGTPKPKPKPKPTPDKPKPTKTPTPDKPKPTTTPTPDKPKPTPTSTPTPEEPTPTPTPEEPKPEPKKPELDPAPRGNAPRGGGRNDDPGPGPVTVPRPQPTTPRVNPAPPAPPKESSTPRKEAPKAPEVKRPVTPPKPEPKAPKPEAPAESGPIADPS